MKYETMIFELESVDDAEKYFNDYIQRIPADRKIHSITPVAGYHGYTKYLLFVLERLS